MTDILKSAPLIAGALLLLVAIMGLLYRLTRRGPVSPRRLMGWAFIALFLALAAILLSDPSRRANSGMILNRLGAALIFSVPLFGLRFAFPSRYDTPPDRPDIIGAVVQLRSRAHDRTATTKALVLSRSPDQSELEVEPLGTQGPPYIVRMQDVESVSYGRSRIPAGSSLPVRTGLLRFSMVLLAGAVLGEAALYLGWTRGLGASVEFGVRLAVFSFFGWGLLGMQMRRHLVRGRWG
jgi:hypothetical protein